MNIIKLLSAFPEAEVRFREGPLAFRDLVGLLKETDSIRTTGPFHWQGEWRKRDFLGLLSALKEGLPVICAPEGTRPPHLQSDELALRTSGSEGAPKWVIHDHQSLTRQPLIEIKGAVAALLHPAHAAGLDLIFQCIRQGQSFSFVELGDLEDPWDITSLFGPPQALGHLLAFAKKFHKLLSSLTTFYVSADSLSPAVYRKIASLDFTFSIENFYGSSETLCMRTLTNPQAPWLIRPFTEEVQIVGGKVFYIGPALARSIWKDGERTMLKSPYPVGDILTKEGDWYDLQANDRNQAKVWGLPLNLKECENALLDLPGVSDALLSVEKMPPVGEYLHLQLWTDRRWSKEELIESIPLLRQWESLLNITLRPPEQASLLKKKRKKS